MKKVLSLVMAAAMALSVALPMSPVAYAEETPAAVTEQATAETAQAPAAGEETPAASEDTATNDEKNDTLGTEGTPAVMSLRPMQETRDVYLTLGGYTKEQLQAFPVDNVLAKLISRTGDAIAVDPGYTTAWFYFAQDDFDEMHSVGTGDTVDLWSYNNKYATDIYTSYEMYLVVGNGKQMDDAGNHRYIITVELNTYSDTEESMYYKVFDKDGNGFSSYTSSINKFGYGEIADGDLLAALQMPGNIYSYRVSDFNQNDPYTIKLETGMFDKLKRSGYKAEVYPMSAFLNFRNNNAALTGEITDQITTTGVSGLYAAPITAANVASAPNVWAVVIKDVATSRMVGYYGFGVEIKGDAEGRSAATLKKTNSDGSAGAEVSQTKMQPADENYFFYAVDAALTGNMVTTNKWRALAALNFALPAGSSRAEDYLMTLERDSIRLVYAGKFNTLEEISAAPAQDITDQIFGSGYSINLESGKYITIVTNNNTVTPCSVYGYVSSGASAYADTSFYINRAQLAPQSPGGYITYLNTYVADMAGYSDIPLDTYYLYDEKYDVGGYQLLMINQVLTADEMKHLIPTFSVTSGTQVNSGGVLQSGVTTLANAIWSDSIPETVAFQVSVPGVKLKNYQVTFATKKVDPTLFVAGPDERFVNLTADNNFVHDVLVANLGSSDLTDVKVELINPVNVKLDDYWTIGGDGNNTLPAFSGTIEEYRPHGVANDPDNVDNRYATLSNIAKVRLLPAGDGEISGTLRVTAAGGQTRDIALTGIAATPKIIAGAMPNGVKYVPYSYMVATDNMYNWNRSVYKLTSGTLPAGMSLYAQTGEIYGIPTESGTFTFTVQVDYSSNRFAPSEATYTIVIEDNGDVVVSNATDIGYNLSKTIGKPKNLISGYNPPSVLEHYVLDDTSTDQLITSQGVIGEFRALWLNGERLTPNVDYVAVSGSTRITIKSQTFAKARQSGANTIAFEFRVGGTSEGKLKRAAQNFYLSEDTSGGTSGGSAGGSSGSSSGSNNNAAAQAAAAVSTAGGVTLQCNVVNAAGAPVPGITVELHSTPRITTTNANGVASFSGVEFGAHTLYVKAANGTVLTTRSFTLVNGAVAPGSGERYSVNNGGSLALTIAVNAGAAAGAKLKGIPQTGDSFNMGLLVVLMLASGCGMLGLYGKKRKNTK